MTREELEKFEETDVGNLQAYVLGVWIPAELTIISTETDEVMVKVIIPRDFCDLRIK